MVSVTGGRSRADEELVTRTLVAHGRALLATAQRHSLCADDAADAYQRALEIFLRNAPRLDPREAHKWLHTVVKHEAITLRAERQRVLPRHAHDFAVAEARHDPSPDDSLLEADHVARMSEALARLKPAEAQALWLKATGRSYAEIAGELGWTRTKVNRCLAEGRARLRAGVEGIEAGEECARWAPLLGAIADGSAGAAELTAARRHLRNCPGCRADIRTLHDEQRTGLTAVFPVGLVLAGLQERAIGALVRAHAMAETLVSGKAAAVAASAAAIAGGSITVVDRALEPDRARQGHVRAAAAADLGTSPAASAGAPRASGPATAPLRPRSARAAATSDRTPRPSADAGAASNRGAGRHGDLGPGWAARAEAAPGAGTTDATAPGRMAVAPTATAASSGSIEPSSAEDPGFLP